jgi:hypothetical protein
MVASCETDNKILGSIKGWEFLDHVSRSQILKAYSSTLR